MSQLGEVIVNLTSPILIAAFIAAVALGFGAFLIGPVFRQESSRVPLVESFAVGTIVISLLTFLWAELAWMGSSARWSLGALVILLGIIGWIQYRPRWELNPASFRNRTILILSLVLAVGVLLRIILSPLAPPTGLDECRTHLPLALKINELGRMVYHPEVVFGSFPQNTEMLYVWGIYNAPLTVAHYLNFIAYLFSLLAIVRLGRVVFSVKTGWLAALLLGSMGMLQFMAGTATPDIWIVFYMLAVVLSLAEGIKESSHGRVLLAGVILGGAAGVSYMSLIAALGLAIAFTTVGRKLPGTNPLPAWTFPCAVLLFLLFAMPWYVRNVYWFLNPVFPFYSSTFPPGGGLYGVFGPESALNTGWLMHGETAGAYFQRGELWLHILAMWSTWIAIPAGLWFWRSSPFVRVAITWTLLTWAFWMVVGDGVLYFPYYVYLVPVNLLILAHFLGLAYSLPSGDHRGRFFRMILWIILIGWIGISGARAAQINPPLTHDGRVNILSRLHGSYDLIVAANQAIADDRKAVGILCEDGRLYANFQLLGGGDVGWANHRVISDSCTSPETLATLLHERYQADYLIVHEERLREHGGAVFTQIESVIRSSEFSEYFREVARVGQGVVYHVANPAR